MTVEVCLVCFKTFEVTVSLINEIQESETCDDLPLLPKFLKFTENYLGISIRNLAKTATKGGRQSFCETCELGVINPTFQVYEELLSAQLRLACKLKQMGRLLENSQSCASDELKLLKNQLLATQLGIESGADLEEFRSLLTAKCEEKGSNGQPNVLLEPVIIIPSPEVEIEEVVRPNHNSPIHGGFPNPNVGERTNGTETEMEFKYETIYYDPSVNDNQVGGGENEADSIFHPNSNELTSSSSHLPLTQQLPQHSATITVGESLVTDLEQNQNKKAISTPKNRKRSGKKAALDERMVKTVPLFKPVNGLLEVSDHRPKLVLVNGPFNQPKPLVVRQKRPYRRTKGLDKIPFFFDELASVWRCKKCDYTNANPNSSAIKSHADRHKKKICPVCLCEFSQKRDLDNHKSKCKGLPTENKN